jgi:acetolactate synthase-1/2/3 large subunit
LIALGHALRRPGDRNVRTYAPARIIHADIDPAEIGKNVAVEVPIVGRQAVLVRADRAGRRGRAGTRADYFAQLAEWGGFGRVELARLWRLA